jgi:hypothetical protein
VQASKMTRTMRISARYVFWIALLIGALVSVSGSAQIIEIREYHGRQIACSRSGLIGWYTNCGADDFYSQIFLGSVQSIKPIKVGEFDEFRLILKPEEVFRGDVPANFTVNTSQGECLPEIHPGDRWLFYIRTDKERGPLLAYENESVPIAAADEALSRLRRLAGMTDSGLVIGRLSWGWFGSSEDDLTALAGKELLVTSDVTRKQYRAVSDQNAYFEFEPLPVGKYRLGLPSATGLWTDDDGEIAVSAGACQNYLMKMAPDGRIAGLVTTAQGKPAVNLPVKMVSIDGATRGASYETTDDTPAGPLKEEMDVPSSKRIVLVIPAVASLILDRLSGILDKEYVQTCSQAGEAARLRTGRR